jgi:hypothetical protein
MTCANYKGTMGTFRTICAALLAMGAVCGAAAAHRGGGATARDAAPGLAWTGYGGDPQLTNYHSGTSLEPAEAPSLGLAWQLALDGPVLASPLALDGRVFVATEAGSVYALDAVTGRTSWSRSLATQDAAGCGSWGISSTGTIDPETGLLYVANADGLVHALDVVTGEEAPGWPVRVTDRPTVEYVWGGLRLAAGRLYVPISSYCDAPDAENRPAEGRVVALDPATGAQSASWDTVPGPDNMGGVWGWGGVSVEPDGSALYTAVGNSEVLDPSCSCDVDDAGFGDSVVRLTPDLQPVSSDRPKDVPRIDDYDFGAAPTLFRPPGCPPLAAANNKDDVLYVWDRTDLAKGPLYETAIGNVSQPFAGSPSWSPRLNMLFDAGAKVIVNDANTGDGASTPSRSGRTAPSPPPGRRSPARARSRLRSCWGTSSSRRAASPAATRRSTRATARRSGRSRRRRRHSRRRSRSATWSSPPTPAARCGCSARRACGGLARRDPVGVEDGVDVA